jgi:hypothetical protein
LVYKGSCHCSAVTFEIETQIKGEEENCNYLHLNSGTQRERAHKFYFKQGFSIASYHFSKNISGL